MTSTAISPDVDVASLCPAIIIPALNEEPAIDTKFSSACIIVGLTLVVRVKPQ